MVGPNKEKLMGFSWTEKASSVSSCSSSMGLATPLNDREDKVFSFWTALKG